MRTFFNAIAEMVIRHTGKVLIGCAVMTVLLIAASSRLSLKTRIVDMMPENIPLIDEYMEIIDDYASESSVMITVEDPDKNLASMKKCADELATRLQRIQLIRPDTSQKLSLRQKIASLRDAHPIEGVTYDTVSLVKRIDYKADNEFIDRHGMMMQNTDDLEYMTDMFGSLSLTGLVKNINDNFETEYIDDSQNMTTLDGEQEAVEGLENIRRFYGGIDTWLQTGDSAKAAQSVRRFVSGREYMISPDNTLLLMILQPSISFNQFEELMYLGYRIDDTLAYMQQKYQDIKLGRTGAMMLQIDENNAMAKDFGWPSVVALLCILILLIGSFRTWKNPFFSVFTLVIGIIWVSGILALLLHYLTMMSAGFGVVLIGLGIDFGIHFISGFRDGREQGKSSADSIRYMYSRVGRGVITGAVTTAIVFFSLPLTGFKAYGQMGTTMGIGIIGVLVAMLLLLPALIMWDHKGYSVSASLCRRLHLGFLIPPWHGCGRLLRRFFALAPFRFTGAVLQFRFLDTAGRVVQKPVYAVLVLLVSAVLLWLSVRGGLNMGFEYDMMKLVPQNTPGQITQNHIIDKFEMSPDFAMVTASSLDSCRSLVHEFKKIGNRTGLIGRLDAISEYIPERQVQEKNREIILRFRDSISAMPLQTHVTIQQKDSLYSELVRLHQNIVEIGELSIMSLGEKNKIIRKCDQIVGKRNEDSEILSLAETVRAQEDPGVLDGYVHSMSRTLKQRLLKMASTDFITLKSLPRDITRRYTNPHNDALLIYVYPKGYIWDQKRLERFNEYTAGVTPRITGMPAIMDLMIEMMIEKGRLAVLIGAVAIALFLLLDFRSLFYTICAMIPLSVGCVWMVGLMSLTGMSFSIMNFMALPIIIGIGIDDGVHMLHRYRIEGPFSLPVVLKYTGRAILLTSLTTMIGFGSMGLASHRGLASLGQSLFWGVGACFVSSIIVLPAILTLVEHAKTLIKKH